MDYAIPTDELFVLSTKEKIVKTKESLEQREAIKKVNEAKVETKDGCVASYIFKKT